MILISSRFSQGGSQKRILLVLLVFLLWSFLGSFRAGNYAESEPTILRGVAYAQGEVKFLVFGPYVPLSPGKYQVVFTLKVSDNSSTKPVATLEVVAKNAQAGFASRTIKGTDFRSQGSYEDFDLPFETTLGAKDFEFRIVYLGGSRLWAEKIGVTQIEDYSQVEAVGAHLIRGNTENSIETRNFLKGSPYKVIDIDSPLLSRRMGRKVLDQTASTGKAWMVEPWMLAAASVSSGEIPQGTFKGTSEDVPLRAPGPLLLLIVGFIAACLSLAASKSAYRRKDGSARLKELRREITSLFVQRRSLLLSLLVKHLLLAALIAGVILSAFFNDKVSGAFPLRRDQAFTLYIFLYFAISLIWDIDYMLLIILVVTSLAGSTYYLISGKEELAGIVATYVYYFLVVGAVLQIIRYARVARRDQLAPKGVKEVAFDQVSSPRKRVRKAGFSYRRLPSLRSLFYVPKHSARRKQLGSAPTEVGLLGSESDGARMFEHSGALTNEKVDSHTAVVGSQELKREPGESTYAAVISMGAEIVNAGDSENCASWSLAEEEN